MMNSLSWFVFGQISIRPKCEIWSQQETGLKCSCVALGQVDNNNSDQQMAVSPFQMEAILTRGHDSVLFVWFFLG